MGLYDDMIRERAKCPSCSNHYLHASTNAINILLLLWGAATTKDANLVLVCQILGAANLYSFIKRITLLMK